VSDVAHGPLVWWEQLWLEFHMIFCRSTNPNDLGLERVKWETDEEYRREVLLLYTTQIMALPDHSEIFLVSHLSKVYSAALMNCLWSVFLTRNDHSTGIVSEFGRYIWSRNVVNAVHLCTKHFLNTNVVCTFFRYHTHKRISFEPAEDRSWWPCWKVLHLDRVCFP
jgi:hypothetical protein